MRFTIDVVYLSREDEVVSVAKNVRPFRFSFGKRGAFKVLELAGGAVDHLSIAVGEKLVLRFAHDS